MRFILAATSLALALLVTAGAACRRGAEPPSSPAGSDLEPHAPQLEVRLAAPSVSADQGFSLRLDGLVALGDRGLSAAVRIEWDDGSAPVDVRSAADGRFTAEHRFLRAGAFVARAEATLPGLRASSNTLRIDVRPRKLLYIQGMVSDSLCPDGARFATRAPAWLTPYLASAFFRGELTISKADTLFFSYSGRYCDGGNGANGAPADYSGTDTCSGIARVYAGRLRALVDAVAPARVTIVAHSMGGVVAAYLVATDPGWARDHIVSVVTFDSPLVGINLVRTGVLSVGSWFSDDCGATSTSVRDLDDGGGVVRTARLAASASAFYTVDATAAESRGPGRLEAVPGDSTHITGERLHAVIDQDHRDVWGEPGDIRQLDKRRLVACALLGEAAECLGAR